VKTVGVTGFAELSLCLFNAILSLGQFTLKKPQELTKDFHQFGNHLNAAFIFTS